MSFSTTVHHTGGPASAQDPAITSAAVTATQDALLAVTYAAPAVVNDALVAVTYAAPAVTNDALLGVTGTAFPAGGTGAAAGGWDTAGHRDAAIASFAADLADMVEARAVIAELQVDLGATNAALAAAAVDEVESRAVIAELQTDLAATNVSLAAAAVDTVEARAVVAELQADITAVIADNTLLRGDVLALQSAFNLFVSQG
jgi:hypothetical protein